MFAFNIIAYMVIRIVAHVIDIFLSFLFTCMFVCFADFLLVMIGIVFVF